MFLLLIACVTPQRTAELEDAEQRWDAAGIDDYAYTLTWRCFCPEGGVPVTIEVQAGEVVASTAEEELDATYEARTVPDLFDTVRDAIASAPDAFEVTYDATLGYPTMLEVDPMANALDEEYGFEAAELAAAG